LANTQTATLALTFTQAGSYTFRLMVTDDAGALAIDEVIVIVKAQPLNQPPVATLTSPKTDGQFSAGDTISLQAAATDADGTIAKVEFYADTQLLSSVISKPYTYEWKSVAAGTYSITAKAYDNANSVTTSNATAIKVLTKPTPNEGTEVPVWPTASALYPDVQPSDFAWLKYTFTGAEIVTDSDGVETATGPVKTVNLPYDLWKPDHYEGGGTFPLVLYLHGNGEKGTWGASNDGSNPYQNNGDGKELYTLFTHGITQWLSGFNRTNFPIFLAGVQCCTEAYYGGYDDPNMNRLLQNLIVELKKTYPIDANRVYITGLSMGGIGTYDQMARNPDVYAAAVGLSSWTVAPAQVAKFKHIPIWSFCGASDEICDNDVTQMDHIGAGGTHILTRYNAGGHDGNVWRAAYGTSHLLPWLLAQKRGAPAPRAGPGFCVPTAPAGIGINQTYALTTDYPQFSGIYTSSTNFELASLTGISYVLNRNDTRAGLQTGTVSNAGTSTASWAFSDKILEAGNYSLGLVCQVNNSFNPSYPGRTYINTRVNITHP
jgi:poly(3-hydroxybutyrate) depolymerase